METFYLTSQNLNDKINTKDCFKQFDRAAFKIMTIHPTLYLSYCIQQSVIVITITIIIIVTIVLFFFVFFTCNFAIFWIYYLILEKNASQGKVEFTIFQQKIRRLIKYSDSSDRTYQLMTRVNVLRVSIQSILLCSQQD